MAYITKSSAGHDLEDVLATMPGLPFDWYEGMLRAAIEGELQVAQAGREHALTNDCWCNPVVEQVPAAP